jgi:hypothetical protein
MSIAIFFDVKKMFLIVIAIVVSGCTATLKAPNNPSVEKPSPAKKTLITPIKKEVVSSTKKEKPVLPNVEIKNVSVGASKPTPLSATSLVVKNNPQLKAMMAQIDATYMQKDYASALVAAQRTQRLFPNSALVYHRFSLIYMAQKKWVLAETMCRRALLDVQDSNQKAELNALLAELMLQQKK